MNKKEKRLALVLLIFIGIVLGGLVGEFADKQGIWWLNYGKEFGLPSPVILDLNIIKFVFSFTIKITVSTILGILVGLIIYHFL